MSKAARHRFELHSTMEGSQITRIEHLQHIAEQTGEDPPELNGPEMPGIVAHVWEWFLELSAARGQGAIAYSEIKAWSQLTGRRPTAFELELIKILDAEFLAQRHQQQQRQSRLQSQPVKRG